MSIIRVKKDKNYFAASNVPFNDKRLSWEARGVMGYLLSKPDNWQVRFDDLVNQGDAKRFKLRRILRNLKHTDIWNARGCRWMTGLLIGCQQ